MHCKRSVYLAALGKLLSRATCRRKETKILLLQEHGHFELLFQKSKHRTKLAVAYDLKSN